MRIGLCIVVTGLVALLLFTTTRRNQSYRKEFAEAAPRRAKSYPTTQTGILTRSERPGRLDEVARTDPDQSIQMLEDLLADPESSGLKEITVWFVENGREAANWIESLPDGPLRNGFIERLLPLMARTDPRSALAIADSFNGEEMRDSARSSVFESWAREAPQDALAAIMTRQDLRDSPILGRTFVSALSESPDRIAQFLDIIPEGAVDQSFLGQAAERLLAKNPAAIQQLWAGSARPAWRSAIADAMLQQLGRNGPQNAFAWAAHLSAENERSEAMQSLFRRAVQRDPGTAPALLNSPLLGDQDRRLLTRIGTSD